MNDEYIKAWNKKYSLIENERLGGGGNAKVYKIKNQNNNNIYALKVLTKNKREPKLRFIDEIKIMLQCKDIRGVLPILDYSYRKYQYIMPIAQPITDVLHKDDSDTTEFIVAVVSAFIQLSQTLSELHQKNIAHRDIKPANLYYYNNCFCFGDFGLVEFPESNNDLTRSDKALGAIFTMAPEMKRDPKYSDGKKADVYSLAKTLWIILSGEEKGFEGVYNFNDKQHGLRFFDEFQKVHLVELEDLLQKSTSNNPDERPTVQQFKSALENYLSILDDDELSQKSDWEFLNKYLFPFGQESAVWRNLDKIIEILNIVGTSPAYNHMLLSTKGGLDFKKAEKANEEGCIYVYDTLGICYLCKPKCLIYESFAEKYTWNYFLLELEDLESIFSDVYDREILVEDYPGNYVSAQYSQYGVYDYDEGTPLPEGFKTLCRYLRGKFLFVLKGGPYNHINGTYDGRHGQCTSDEFRKYIERLIDITQKIVSKGFSEKQALRSHFFDKNPFAFEVEKESHNHNYPDDFIETNFEKWCFKDSLTADSINDGCRFLFVFVPERTIDFSDILCEERLYLCKDGYIKKQNSENTDECYWVSDRETAIEISNSINQIVSSLCSDNGYDEPIVRVFTIEFKKGQMKPTHLFTKEELKNAMREADDRVHNQLIVDENGYIKVIRDGGYGYTYPVSHESWDAGNCYVGKYSNLSTLDEDYIAALDAWLMYLIKGEHIRTDYVPDDIDENDLIEKIKKYY